jgi:hypothetical protein
MESLSDVAIAARVAGLSPLVTRVAMMLADAGGRDRAYSFIEDCREEDERRALVKLREDFQTIRQHLNAMRQRSGT